jgi:hypothetical protein
MKNFCQLGALVLCFFCLPAQADLYVTIVQGMGGEPRFEEQFHEQSRLLAEASRALTDIEKISLFRGEDASRDKLLSHFAAISSQMSEDDRAAIYLIGHGSYDGEAYKFNIPGLDINTDDILEIMSSLPGENHFLLNTSSTSGALLEPLASEGQILVTATRSGNERNATYFGQYFVDALSNEEADLNKNNNISIQEAFDFAERQVADYFESQGQLATEHPEIRGDGAAQFTLARLDLATIDTSGNPELADLQQQREDINRKIEDLQLRRNEFSNSDYIQQLQALILESARINEEIDQLSSE